MVNIVIHYKSMIYNQIKVNKNIKKMDKKQRQKRN